MNVPLSGNAREVPAEPGECSSPRGPESATLLANPRKGHNDEPTQPAEPAQPHDVTAHSCDPFESHSSAAEISPAHASPTEARESPADLDACDMEMLNQVSDAKLLEALRNAEPQIAMLALAGAPPHLLDRVLGQLPRRQAKQFRRQLHSLQPTRIRDLLDAQRQFVHMALEGASCEARGASYET